MGRKAKPPSKGKQKAGTSHKATARVVNKDKEDSKIRRKEKADKELSKARKKLEDTRKRIADRRAERAKLEESARDAKSEEDKAAAQKKMADLDGKIQQDDTEMQDAETEEKRLEQEAKDIDMEDVTEVREVDPDKPEKTVEASQPESSSGGKKSKTSTKTKRSKKPSGDGDDSGGSGSSDGSGDSDDGDESDGDDTDEEEDVYPDLLNHAELKKGLGLTSGICKGWTKVGREGKRPVIQIGPDNAPCFRTQKASQFAGIIDPDPKYNLVKQRRADLRNKDDTFKFTMDDIVGIQGVSWYVPDDYEGNPAEMLKPLPPKLTKQQKDAMKARGEEIPEQPKPVVVQVYFKWRQIYMRRWRTFETRSGVRRLYGDDGRADKFIYKAALEQERKYQEYLKGQRPPRSKSPTPFVPGKENTPPRGTPPVDKPKPDGDTTSGDKPEPPGGTPPVDKPKPDGGTTSGDKPEPPGGTPPVDKPKPDGGTTSGDKEAAKAAKKAAMAAFKEDHLMAAEVDKWTDLTAEQAATGMAAFRIYLRDHHPELAG